MNTAEFMGIMQELNTVYGDRKFPLTRQALTIWQKYIGNCEERGIGAAVERFVRKSPFPPTISEILAEYKNVLDGESKKTYELRNLFAAVVAEYPNAQGIEEEESAFDDLVDGDIERAKKLLSVTHNIVSGWEISGQEDIPALNDFLRRIRL